MVRGTRHQGAVAGTHHRYYASFDRIRQSGPMELLQSGLKAAKGVYKTAKYQMEGLSEIEVKTRECTNADPWGAHGKDLAALASATHHREEMYLIMKTLGQRLEEREEKWRHVYKALNVIEYLVAHGHENVLKELKQNIRSIEYLDTFKFKDASGRDQGVNVRQKASVLVRAFPNNHTPPP